MKLEVGSFVLKKKKQQQQQRNLDEKRKQKRKGKTRENELFRLFSACGNASYHVLVRSSTYRMEHNKTSTIALNFEMNVASRTQAQLSNRQRTETDLSAPH